jgi:hypothetical protein
MLGGPSAAFACRPYNKTIRAKASPGWAGSFVYVFSVADIRRDLGETGWK